MDLYIAKCSCCSTIQDYAYGEYCRLYYWSNVRNKFICSCCGNQKDKNLLTELAHIPTGYKKDEV